MNCVRSHFADDLADGFGFVQCGDDDGDWRRHHPATRERLCRSHAQGKVAKSKAHRPTPQSSHPESPSARSEADSPNRNPRNNVTKNKKKIEPDKSVPQCSLLHPSS